MMCVGEGNRDNVMGLGMDRANEIDLARNGRRAAWDRGESSGHT